jgi:hypothetical protein
VAIDQRHGKTRPPIGRGIDLLDRNDLGLLKPVAELHLLNKPANHLEHVVLPLRLDPHSQFASKVDAAALQDHTRTTAGDSFQGLVATGPVWGPPGRQA